MTRLAPIVAASRPVAPALPPLLARLALDMYAIVHHWSAPANLSGTARGRFFEELFARYCEARKLRLTEKAGSRTINGVRAASLLAHETDAVIATPDFLLQVELKHLSSPLGKNELLIFNQKGFDFLYANDSAIRGLPLYRVVVSAGSLSEGARRFALQWGITVIEPDYLPFAVLYGLAAEKLSPEVTLDRTVRREIIDEMPRLIVPLQKRARQFSRSLETRGHILNPARVERALAYFQSGCGNRFQRLIESSQPHWLKRRCDTLYHELYGGNRAPAKAPVVAA